MTRMTQPNFIHGIGKPSKDWTQQSKRIVDSEGNVKPPRRRCKHKQVLLTGFSMLEDVTITKIEPVTITSPDGKPLGQQLIGFYGRRRVKAVKRAPWMASNGKSPHIWKYAEDV